MEKDIPCKQKLKECRSTYIYIRKINFKQKTVIRDKKYHSIMTKGSIHRENITIRSKYIFTHTRATKSIKQTLVDLKGQTDIIIIIRGLQ